MWDAIILHRPFNELSHLLQTKNQSITEKTINKRTNKTNISCQVNALAQWYSLIYLRCQKGVWETYTLPIVLDPFQWMAWKPYSSWNACHCTLQRDFTYYRSLRNIVCLLWLRLYLLCMLLVWLSRIVWAADSNPMHSDENPDLQGRYLVSLTKKLVCIDIEVVGPQPFWITNQYQQWLRSTINDMPEAKKANTILKLISWINCSLRRPFCIEFGSPRSGHHFSLHAPLVATDWLQSRGAPFAE